MPQMTPGRSELQSDDAKGVAALVLPRGFTTREVARRYRVSEDKVRAWIQRRELIAVNTAASLSAKPRWVITPDALAAFEAKRAGGSPPKAQRRKRTALRDFYPD